MPSGILVHAAELADVGGERVVVCTEAAGRVSTWNPSTGEWRPVGLAPPGDVDAREVARFTSVGALDGRATLLAAGDEHDGHVVAWDLETGAVVRGPLVGEYFAGAWSVLLAEVEGRPFALAGNAGPGLTFWELDTDGAQAVHLAGPTDGTTSLEFGELAGGPVAVSAGHDGVRVWDLRNPGAIRSVFYADEHAYRGAGISRVDGREIVVAAVGSVVELLDPEWNEPIGEPLTGHDGVITALALTEVGGRALAVTAAEDRTARVWDLAAGAPVGEPLTDHGKAIAGVSTGELADGRAVAVTAGGRDGVVRIWDLAAIVA
ncbi:hypothetical protein Pen01_24290 [Phytomonospora endophytica]|nr:hypothetical protein Pen01_24290 [Phytomonospora endophytica]